MGREGEQEARTVTVIEGKEKRGGIGYTHVNESCLLLRTTVSQQRKLRTTTLPPPLSSQAENHPFPGGSGFAHGCVQKNLFSTFCGIFDAK